MIKLDQIEEWIHEAEERPTSAPLIIRYIAGRLRDLSARNEELLAENIELRTERKVEEYESRIATLEYQLEILKRQMSGEVPQALATAAVETLSLLIYNGEGQVLRLEVPVTGLASGSVFARLAGPLAGGMPRLLVTSPTEELLFVFDTGRTVSMPVSDIAQVAAGDPVAGDPAAGDLAARERTWQDATLVEPHGGEELAAVLPIARMSLFDCCIQISRRGCAKKMMKTSFESHVAKNFVGSGIKGKPDKTCSLALCGKDDLLVIATKDGFLLSLDVTQLPYTIEEILKLGPTDYIAASVIAGSKPSLLVITHNGKAIHREASWLEKASTFKSRGQPVFSQARREAGVRVVGAAAVDESDWSAALSADGRVTLNRVSDLLASGSLTSGEAEGAAEILDFVAFSAA